MIFNYNLLLQKYIYTDQDVMAKLLYEDENDTIQEYVQDVLILHLNDLLHQQLLIIVQLKFLLCLSFCPNVLK